MESVFVAENLIDINQFQNSIDQFQKLKVGEVFQLNDSALSLCCTNCFQEFQYFTEFSLHIQEHFERGDIAQMKEIKEEPSCEIETPTENEQAAILTSVKYEVMDDDGESHHENDNFDYSDMDDGWSDVEFNANAQEPDIQISASETTEPPTFNEGTDYVKIDNDFKCLTCDHKTPKWKYFREHLRTHSNPVDVVCPICGKLFASNAYVQKHARRTHNVKISIETIRAAQPNRPEDVRPEKPKPKPNSHTVTPNIASSSTSFPPNEIKTEDAEKASERVKKGQYIEGRDYRKIDHKYECLYCHRKMVKLDHLKEHLLTHTSEKNVFCPFCARAFITESYVRKHVNRTHKMKITAEEIKKAQAAIDVSKTKMEWASGQDRNSAGNTSQSDASACVEGGTVKCLFCWKKFTKARYAQKHMRLIHGKNISITEVVKSQDYNEAADDEVKFGNSTNGHIEATEGNETVTEESEVQKNFECFECHKYFVTIQSLRIHSKLHSGIKYSCPYCYKLFAMKSYVRDHIVIMHGIKRDDIPKESILPVTGHFEYQPRLNIEQYECYLCKNTYRRRNRLREHMDSHISGPYLCVICGTVYKSTDTLRHHMERHEANPDEPHQCSDCGKTYPTRRYMLSHYRTIHLNKKRKKVQVERTYDIACQICDKKFFSRHNLNQHMMVHNRNPDELICHICGWEFKERSNLKQHMESHGNNKTKCEVCKKVLSNRYLQEHMKIHAGNKEFQCSTCGQQFVSRERLRRHMVRHTGEPKYKCDLCPKAYTRSDKLLYHRRTHDQQMTHTCQICNIGFFSIKSLRKHVNKHYLEQNGVAKPDEPEENVEILN